MTDFRRNLGFAALAIGALALGMMATIAICSVVHAVAVDPFPYKDIDRLTSVRVRDPDQPGVRLCYSTDQFLEQVTASVAAVVMRVRNVGVCSHED